MDRRAAAGRRARVAQWRRGPRPPAERRRPGRTAPQRQCVWQRDRAAHAGSGGIGRVQVAADAVSIGQQPREPPRECGLRGDLLVQGLGTRDEGLGAGRDEEQTTRCHDVARRVPMHDAGVERRRCADGYGRHPGAAGRHGSDGSGLRRAAGGERPGARQRTVCHHPAQQDLRAARARRAGGCGRAVPQSRRAVSQRLLALARPCLRPGPLSQRREQEPHVRHGRGRARVLQHPSRR